MTVPTPEERKVLEACAAAEVVMLSNGWMLDGNSNRSVVEAELARRAARKESKT